MTRRLPTSKVTISARMRTPRRTKPRHARLEELPVGRRSGLAVTRPRLLARAVGAVALARVIARGRRSAVTTLEDAQRTTRLSFDRTDAERDPLRRVLEPVGRGVAAGVDVLETLRLDPHPLALQESQDAGLPRLRALALAVRAGRLVVALVARRLLVGRDVALVVAQDHLVIRVADQVVRHHRDLAAPTRRVDHICRDRVARRVAAQALHDLEALADGRPEVPGALDEVALVEVVRSDPVLDELVDERALDVDAVVHAGEQDALVADREARPGQLVDRPADLRRDLV